jgi:cobalt-zinc-cadmium efflux system membrane fusion protein
MGNKRKVSFSILIFLMIVGCSIKQNKISLDSQSGNLSFCFDNNQKNIPENTTTYLKRDILQDYVDCYGIIKPSPENEVVVSPPIRGIVKNIFIRTGEFVEKGAILAILENSEIVSMQEEYLITRSQYDYYKEDFKRQGELSLENATSLKIMQQAQNEFRKTEAKLYSLKKRLEILGIKSDSIQSDQIQSTIELYAPISGKVNILNIRIGSLCSGENPFCEISGTSGQVICFNLNEDQMVNLNINQPLEFSISTFWEKVFRTETHSVSFSNNGRKVEICTALNDPSEKFETGNIIKTRIFTNKDSVDVLPEESVIHFDNKKFVVIKTTDRCFEINEIEIGKSLYNKCPILSIPENLRKSEFVVKGSKTLFQEIKNAEK